MMAAHAYDHIGKTLGHRMGRVTVSSACQQTKASKLRLVIDESKFHQCGFVKDSDECKKICKHNWSAVVEAQA